MDARDVLTELDSAAVRTAAAAMALERIEQHPDTATVDQIRSELPAIRERLRQITGDITDLWSVARAFQHRVSQGKAA